MGIYSDGNVYGVCWNMCDASDKSVKYFEKTCPKKINLEQIREIKNEYDKLTETECNSAIFKIYTCCSSTYDSGTFMSWFPADKSSIEDIFVNGNV